MTSSNQDRGASDLLAGRTIAYFCAEYGITDILPIYSGGLGVLAGDIVQEAAREKLPFVAVGLFYKYGFFHQHIDCSGQNETTSQIVPAEAHLELVKDNTGETLLIEVPVHERIVYAQVWRFPLEDNSLYLLDTDHWKNSPEDRTITNQLYGGDQHKRIQQELVLAVGGLRTLRKLKIEPSLYHMNEGHSAFLALELASTYLKTNPGSDLHAALSFAKNHLIFTNHTLVPAGNDIFPHDLIRFYLGKYAFDSGLGIDKVLELGYMADKPDHLAMTMLALRMSTRANAVSKLHGEKAVDLWPDFPMESVTNGVHLPAWIAPEMQRVIQKHVPDWPNVASDAKAWKPFSKVDLKELWETHSHLKERMLDEVYARTGIRLEVEPLTVVWARRFATYKRPDLLFADVERLKKLLFSADRPIQIIVAGKAHPADTQGKQIIEHIEYLANFELKHRAVFVDDYSISLAKFLVAGADVWLNTPIFGLEASGTSGMKAASNGVIQFTTPDGWAYEVDWYGLGYPLPLEKAETEIYNLFEKKIIPTYYRRGRQGVPELWAAMMRETIQYVAPHFSSKRMVEDYIKKMYLPVLEQK